MKLEGPVFLISVCPFFQAFSPLEPERLIGSGRANIHSMRQNSGKTMVPVPDRSVAHGTCDRANACIKPAVRGTGQTIGQIRLTLGGHMVGPIRLGKRRLRPLHSCERHVNSVFSISVFAHKRRVRWCGKEAVLLGMTATRLLCRL